MPLHNAAIADVVGYSIAELGENYPVSDHFRLHEFACSDGTDLVLIHPSLLEGLEDLRSALGDLPMTINSGYRTFAYNASVRNSNPRSRHQYGLAADIVVRSTLPEEVAREAERLRFGGIGRYDGFTHVDVWKDGRRW